MPILPFDNPYVQPPTPIQPAGGTGSCSDEGGGFTPPKCPIYTKRTLCEPVSNTSCSCVNNGPKGQQICFTDTTECIYVIIDGVPQPAAVPNALSPGECLTTGTVTDGICTITYTSLGCGSLKCLYQYDGNQWLLANPSVGFYTGWWEDNVAGIQGWLGYTGGSNDPCDCNCAPSIEREPGNIYEIVEGASCGSFDSNSPDVSSIDNEGSCNSAAANNPDYNISWVCETTETENCTDVTDTSFVDATPTVTASIMAAIFAATKDAPINLKGLSPTDRANLIEALIDSSNYPGAKEIIKSTAFDPTTGKIILTYKTLPDIPGMGDKAYAKYLEQMKAVAEAYNNTYLTGKQTITTNSAIGLRLKQLMSNGGKLSTGLASKLSPCLRRIPAIAAFIGAATSAQMEAFAYAIGDGGLSDSDISWTCDPGAGANGGMGGGNNGSNGGGTNNDGKLNPTNGVFLPDGSFFQYSKDGNNSITPPTKTYSGSPSRSNFIQGNLSSTVNMVPMVNNNIPSVIKNNLNLNANYGVPMKSFPVLKVAK